MTNASADYERVVSLFSAQHLTPYVSYMQTDRMMGYDATSTIVVRISDGATLQRDGSSSADFEKGGAPSPLTSPPFRPECYKPVDETATSWHGEPSLHFTLRPTCHPLGNSAFAQLYVDPQTMAPIFVSGMERKNNALADFSESFSRVHGFVVPKSVRVRIRGKNEAAWLKFDVDESFGDYRFLEKYPV